MDSPSDEELIDMAEMWPYSYASWCLTDPRWNSDQHLRVAKKLHDRVLSGESMRSWLDKQKAAHTS